MGGLWEDRADLVKLVPVHPVEPVKPVVVDLATMAMVLSFGAGRNLGVVNSSSRDRTGSNADQALHQLDLCNLVFCLETLSFQFNQSRLDLEARRDAHVLLTFSPRFSGQSSTSQESLLSLNARFTKTCHVAAPNPPPIAAVD